MDILFGKYIYIERNKFLDGRTIVIMKTTPPLKIDKKLYPSLMNFIVQIFFKANALSKKNGTKGFVAICYLENLKKCKLPIKFYVSFAKLLKRIFNDHLYKCIFVDPPILFKNIYYVIKGFIDKKTKKKVVFMKNEEEIDDFLED